MPLKEMKMRQEWEADVDLNRTRAQALLETQFPELAPARLELLGVGWDNTACRVNGEWVFRFPRRELGARLTEREAAVLPRLVPHLPLPIPNPAWVGAPADGYPYAFVGYRQIRGRTACQVEWSEAGRSRCAAPLARFLKALHGIPVDDHTVAEGPGDELERWNMRRRLPMLRERLAAVAERVPEVDPEAALDLAARLAETPPHTSRPVWVHGDLYPRHLLVDAEGLPTGVIDWGDVHLGDPALDLSLALTFLPESAGTAFQAEYGEVDPETWARARFRALFYGVVLTHYGFETEDAAMTRTGIYALRSATHAGAEDSGTASGKRGAL